MRVSQTELILIALLIVYIAFYTHPPPYAFKELLFSPVGKVLGLLGVLYVSMYQSLIVGIFLAIAFIFTSGATTEYLDEKEQTPVKEQPKASGVPKPAVSRVLGDTRLPQKAGKDVKTKPASPAVPKPVLDKITEHFASF